MRKRDPYAKSVAKSYKGDRPRLASAMDPGGALRLYLNSSNFLEQQPSA